MARRKGPSTTYLVMPDRATGRWNVTRDGVPTAGFAQDRETAVSLALAEASQEAGRSGGTVKVCVIGPDGTRTKEWESP